MPSNAAYWCHAMFLFVTTVTLALFAISSKVTHITPAQQTYTTTFCSHSQLLFKVYAERT